MKFLNVIDESEEGFKIIADKLFNEYVIKTHDSEFRIIEMEFYWNSPTHVDNSTYPRKYVNPNSGEWFFHYSGVDIALKNEKGHGGILLRGVCKINNKGETDKDDIYKGPLVTVMRLFSGTSAFSDNIKTKLVRRNFSTSEIKQSKRIGLGKNAIENGAKDFKYRFSINVNYKSWKLL